MANFTAFLYAFALSSALCLFNVKILAPYYHLKYSEKKYMKATGLEISFMLPAYTVCLWLLCMKFSSGGCDIWAIAICILALIASTVDFNHRKIPNELVLLILIISCSLSIYKTITYSDFDYLLSAIGGGLGASLPLIATVIFLERGVGAGDIKLLFAMGIYLESMLSVYFFFTAFVLAAVIAIGLMLMKKASRRSKIVMGPFIACSFVLCVYFDYFFAAMSLYLSFPRR